MKVVATGSIVASTASSAHRDRVHVMARAIVCKQVQMECIFVVALYTRSTSDEEKLAPGSLRPLGGHTQLVHRL